MKTFANINEAIAESRNLKHPISAIVDGQQYTVFPSGTTKAKGAAKTVDAPRNYDLPPNAVSLAEHCRHLFERDPQIRIVERALNCAISSKFDDRPHVVLHGPPACGKTEILLAVRRALGPDRVLQFDATSTTKAGAEELLKLSEKIPPVILVEEIEKTDEKSLRWLLGVMDQRGEIRKTTFRGSFHREVKCLCIATANNMALLKTLMDGALASRFVFQPQCQRPGRKVLQKICEREIERIAGKAEWITPTLDYCEASGTDDPRKVVAIMLAGRDALLSGEFQKDLKATGA